MKKTPTKEQLESIFDYDEENGLLIRSVQTSNRVRVGQLAGHITNHNYRAVHCFGSRYLVHRLIWKMHYGTEPKELDHINGNTLDNRIENLREVTHKQNGQNMRLPKTNTSGCIGVSWHKQTKKWRAYIRNKNKQVYLGVYKNKQDAIAARKAAERKHGFHENHGSM